MSLYGSLDGWGGDGGCKEEEEEREGDGADEVAGEEVLDMEMGGSSLEESKADIQTLRGTSAIESVKSIVCMQWAKC